VKPYTGVPEPAIWMMIALGVAGLGTTLRGSQRRQIAKPA